MPTDRETSRLVRSWLEEGATALPDRVLDAVLDQVPATPQRRSFGPVRRLPEMNSVVKLAVAAAAVVVVAIVGLSFLPRTSGVGGPSAPPSLSPSPSPMAFAVGPLAPGTHTIDDPKLTAVPFSFTVPAGWSGRADGYVYKNGDTEAELGFFTYNVTHVYTDACKSEGALTAIGPTVDDLVQALEDQVGSDASTPVDATLGGYPATRIDMSVPADLDTSVCRNPDALIQIWADAAETSWFAIPVDYDGVGRVYIADVDGQRAVVLPSEDVSTASASDVAELEAIMDSMTFQP
jgi:hypothetical protein